MDDNRLVEDVGSESWTGRTGEEDKQGVDGRHQRMVSGRRTHMHLASWRRTDRNGEELSLKHLIPTGASPWNEEEERKTSCLLHDVAYH